MSIQIALGQIDVSAGSPEKNLEKGARLIQQAANQGCSLILFPEMWTTGFLWNYNLSHLEEQKDVFKQICHLAKSHNIWIGGSILYPEADKGKNRFYLISSEGTPSGFYDKTHLFSFVGENLHLEKGDHLSLLKTPWGNCGLAVCYDIRFPELFRSYALQGAKWVMVPTAFPHPRKDHLVTLARARAIENQMFIVLTNQVGMEEFRDEPVHYFGHSMVIDPWGTLIAAGSEEEELITATIDLAYADEIREKMHVFQDRRPDLYFNG